MPKHFKENAHTLMGTMTFSLPIGIIVLLIFYWIAPEIAFLLPSPHREALQPRINVHTFSVREVLMAACGIVLGAWTHVLWDSFTHRTGWIVERVPLLGQTLLGTGMSSYVALQYLSSVLGLCLLAYIYGRWMNAIGSRVWVWQRPSWRFYLWLVVLGGCFTAATIESHAVHAIASFYFLHGRHFAVIFITSFVRKVLVALCVVSICCKAARFRWTRGSGGSAISSD